MHIEISDTRTLGDKEPVVREMEFHDMPVSIGSHSANVVQLPATDIAPYHAMLLPLGDERWIYQPTSSENKASVNGTEIAEKVDLDDGDTIEIGYFAIKFTLDLEPDLALPEPGNIEELARIREFPLPPRSDVRQPDADISLDAGRQRSLAAFTLSLHGCNDYPSLLERTLSLLMSEFHARTGWVGIRRDPTGQLEFVDGRNNQGERVTELKLMETFAYRCLTRRQFIRIPRTGDGVTQSVLAVPVLCRRGALGLLYVDTKRHRHVYDDADFDFITVVSGVLSAHLDALVEDQLEQKASRIATELALLRDVQARLDPTNAPQWSQLQIAAFAKAGLERAGNVYDIMRLPNGLAAFLVGSVEAQPRRAAVAIGETRSTFRMAGLHADPPHVQLKAMTWLLHDPSSPCALNGVIVVMNPKTGAMEACSAGQIGAVIVDRRGEVRSLVNPKHPAAGVERAFDYTGHAERLKPGETLAFYSEGCTTVWRPVR